MSPTIGEKSNVGMEQNRSDRGTNVDSNGSESLNLIKSGDIRGWHTARYIHIRKCEWLRWLRWMSGDRPNGSSYLVLTPPKLQNALYTIMSSASSVESLIFYDGSL
eukprot:14335233-Ditylum_brightwellii.AAC.1